MEPYAQRLTVPTTRSAYMWSGCTVLWLCFVVLCVLAWVQAEVSEVWANLLENSAQLVEHATVKIVRWAALRDSRVAGVFAAADDAEQRCTVPDHRAPTSFLVVGGVVLESLFLC